jgi:heat shock protein HslJ
MFGRYATVMAAVAVLVGAGCGSSKSSSSGGSTTSASSAPTTTSIRALVGTSWDLASYRDNARMVDAAKGATAVLEFAPAGRLSGSTGCNSFSGTYTVNGSALTLALGPMTQVACTGDVQKQEQAITGQFAKVSSYAIAGTQLTLSGDGKELFAYTAGATGVAGTSWKVTGVNNGKGGVVTSSGTAKLTAVFASDGQFSGFGGCNQLSGPYTTSGANGLKIGPLASTRKLCGGDADQLEAEYTAALQSVAKYSISGGTLTMRDGAGATQVTATSSG